MARVTSGGAYLYTNSLSSGFQNTPFSYSGWVKLNSTSDQVVLCFSDIVTNANLYLAVFILSGKWFISRRDAINGVQGTAGTATPTTGRWYHVCLTANAATGEKLYIDGSLEATNSHVSMLENFNGFSLGIGRRTAGTFNGGNSDHAFGGLYAADLDGTAAITALSGGAHPLVADSSAWDIFDLTGAATGNELGRFGNTLTQSGTPGTAESPLVFIGSPITANQAAASGSTDALLADDIASSTSVGSPSIGQTHALSASDVASASSVTTPAIGQVHALTANDISASPSVGNPTLAENTGDNLLAEDIVAQPSVGTPSIGQIHALTASDIAATPSTGTPSLGIVGEQSNEGGQYPINDPRHPYWRNRIEVEDEPESTPEAEPVTPASSRPRRANKPVAPAASSPAPADIARALAGVPSIDSPPSADPVTEPEDNFAQREMRRIEEMLLLELID